MAILYAKKDKRQKPICARITASWVGTIIFLLRWPFGVDFPGPQSIKNSNRAANGCCLVRAFFWEAI